MYCVTPRVVSKKSSYPVPYNFQQAELKLVLIFLSLGVRHQRDGVEQKCWTVPLATQKIGLQKIKEGHRILLRYKQTWEEV